MQGSYQQWNIRWRLAFNHPPWYSLRISLRNSKCKSSGHRDGLNQTGRESERVKHRRRHRSLHFWQRRNKPLGFLKITKSRTEIRKRRGKRRRWKKKRGRSERRTEGRWNSLWKGKTWELILGWQKLQFPRKLPNWEVHFLRTSCDRNKHENR